MTNLEELEKLVKIEVAKAEKLHKKMIDAEIESEEKKTQLSKAEIKRQRAKGAYISAVKIEERAYRNLKKFMRCENL